MTDPDQLPALSERSVIRQFLIDYWEGDGDQSMAHSMIFAPSDFEAVRRCVSSFAQQVDWLQQQCDERAELKAKLETAEASLLSAKQPLRAEMAALNKRVTEQNSEILSLRTAIATERARADALEAALKPLAALGLYALDETRGDYIGSDLSGGDIQDKAEALGLLARVEVKEPCSEEYCSCAEYYDKDEWPVQCLQNSPLIATARALLEKKT